MEHFPLPLIGELKQNGSHIELEAPFQFMDFYPDGELKRVVTVPVGFECNFNSVPRGLWNVFPPWKYPEAGVVHDYLYRVNGLTRKEADEIHRRILELKGCPAWLRHTAYVFLRAFAGGAWNKYRAAEKAE